MCRTYHVTTHSTPHYSFGQSRHVMINSTISSGSSIFSMSTGLPSSVTIAMRSPLFHKIKNIHLSFQLFLVFFCEKFAGNGVRIPWNVQLIVPAFPRFLTRKVIRTFHTDMLPASTARSSVHFTYFSHFFISSFCVLPFPRTVIDSARLFSYEFRRDIPRNTGFRPHSLTISSQYRRI